MFHQSLNIGQAVTVSLFLLNRWLQVWWVLYRSEGCTLARSRFITKTAYKVGSYTLHLPKGMNGFKPISLTIKPAVGKIQC